MAVDREISFDRPMSANISSQGISSAPPPPPPAVPAPSLPTAPDVGMPATWPRAAQRVTTVLLLAALALLSWRAFAASAWSTRPTRLDANAAAFRVDVNRADHARLLQLPGVGESLARRIEDSREQYGDFRTVDDLRRVSGIGPATLERLRPFVYVQLPDETDDDAAPPPVARPLAASPKATPPSRPVGKKTETLSEKVDVNHATAEDLQRLPGVGPAMAARIIAAREEKPFRSVDDLRRVRGIGAKTLERLRPFVTADAAAKPRDPDENN
jgi:competence protein ComEA